MVPSRRVFEADARVWLSENAAPEGASVITSLPDLSEVPLDFARWRAWFIDAARQILEWIDRPDGNGHAIFFQSDIRHGGAWIDKGYLVQRAAEDVGLPLAWHKVVCRHPAGTISFGRATWSHMLCFGKSLAARSPGPDVLEAGAMTWTRAMGVNACREACRFLVANTRTKVVVDPYCGKGTALAAANEVGLDAIGVELSARRCRAARALDLARLSNAARAGR